MSPFPLKVLKQLSELERVLDLTGRPLMLDELDEIIYQLRRHRSLEYDSHEAVQCSCSESMRNILAESFHDFFQSRYGVTVTRANPEARMFGDFYTLPSASTLHVLPMCSDGRFDKIMMFVDCGNVTTSWDILEPERHFAIVGVSSVGFVI